MKKKIYISVLTTILCFPLFMWTTLANTVSQSYTTGYGSYYFTYNNDLDTFLLKLGNLGGVNMKGYCQSLIYEFNDTYSGYLDIHLMSDSIWQNATIITENCYVKGKNSAQHDYSIGFKDVTSIKVTVVLPTLTTNNSWSGNKMALTTNYNITRDITSVEDYLEDIETTMGQIDAQLSTMTTSLSNIYGVENASRQLLSEIEYAIRGNNTLYVLADDMGTIITDLNSIINNVSKIDNIIELEKLNNISPESDTAYLVFRTYGELKTFYNDRFPYYTINPDTYSNRVYLYRQKKYYLCFRMYNYSDPWPWNSIHLLDSSFNDVTYNRYYMDQYGGYVIITIEIQTPTTGYYYFKIDGAFANKEFTPIYFGTADNLSDYMASMTHITTQGNAGIINKLDAVVNAINSMSLNVNQMTVNATGITYNVNNTQVNNSVNTYNTNINQVYNVENNYGSQLDTQLQNYNPDNTSIINRLTASSNIMATVLNGINGIELFTVPISVMLVGIVLLAIVG